MSAQDIPALMAFEPGGGQNDALRGENEDCPLGTHKRYEFVQFAPVSGLNVTLNRVALSIGFWHVNPLFGMHSVLIDQIET
jgi:hypothetical protein